MQGAENRCRERRHRENRGCLLLPQKLIALFQILGSHERSGGINAAEIFGQAAVFAEPLQGIKEHRIRRRKIIGQFAGAHEGNRGSVVTGNPCDFRIIRRDHDLGEEPATAGGLDGIGR